MNKKNYAPLCSLAPLTKEVPVRVGREIYTKGGRHKWTKMVPIDWQYTNFMGRKTYTTESVPVKYDSEGRRVITIKRRK